MKTLTYYCLALVAILCFDSTSKAQNVEDDAKKVALAKQVLGQAKVDFATAFATAQKKVPDGKPLIARVEMIKESARFGFYFLVLEKVYEGGYGEPDSIKLFKEKVQEVEVDVKTGEIVKFEKKKEPGKVKKFADAMKAVQGAKVSFKEAMEIGAKRVQDGKVIEVEMEMDGDRAIVEVEFLVEERITQVRIDAKDATSVSVK